MKLKTIAQVVLVSTTLLGLSACSTTKKHNKDGSLMEASNAQTSGVGQGDEFANPTSTNTNLAQKRTYYFDFDRSDVRDSDKDSIHANADYLVANANSKVILEGHTDPRGSREYNVALGERRSNAVAEILKSRGVNSNQIRSVSYGAERLASAGRDEEAYQQDRRASIVYQN